MAIASCGVEPSESKAREADVYSVVIQTVAPEPADSAAELDELDHVAFIGPLEEDADIALEVQAAVVEQLEEFATVRFIDRDSEAIDDARDERPVREGGVLVLVGEVPGGRSPSVDVVRYVDADDTARFRIAVERSGSRWRVVGVETLPSR